MAGHTLRHVRRVDISQEQTLAPEQRPQVFQLDIGGGFLFPWPWCSQSRRAATGFQYLRGRTPAFLRSLPDIAGRKFFSCLA